MSDATGILEISGDSLTLGAGGAGVVSLPEPEGLSAGYPASQRDDATLLPGAMGDFHPSNRVLAPHGRQDADISETRSAVEFYRGATGSEQSWGDAVAKSETSGTSGRPDWSSEDGGRGQRSKLISASYPGPDVVGFPEQRYSRRKTLKKMRVNSNKRIVSHLRRQFRDRAVTWLDEDILESGGHEQQYRFMPKTPGKVDIFTKYNEIGGRVSKEGHILDGLFPGAFASTPPPDSDAVTIATWDESIAVDNDRETSESFASHVLVKDRHGSNIEHSHHPPNEHGMFQKMGSLKLDKGKDCFDERRDEAEAVRGKRFLEALEVQSVTGRSDNSLSSRESRTSSGKSSGSRDGSVGKLSSSKTHVTPRPPEVSRTSVAASDNARVSRPLSPSMTVTSDISATPSYLPHLPHVNPLSSSSNKVSSQHLTLADRDLKLPSLAADARRHSTLSVDPAPYARPQDIVWEAASVAEEEYAECSDCQGVVSPVPTPYPESQDGMDSRRTLEYQQTVDSILQSKVDVRCSWMVNIFRIYVSSTFSDLGAERTILMSKAFPRLRTYCKERGFELQVCDMNWGIKDTSTDEHSYASSCLRELKECEEVSKGPFFVALMGQKLGFQALPDSFSVSDYTSLITTIEKERDAAVGARRPSMFPTQTLEDNLEEIESYLEQKKDGKSEAERVDIENPDEMEKGATEKGYDADLNALQTWYKLDNNSIPPVYVLQPISSQYREILSNDRQKRLRAKNHWLVMYKRLVKALNKYVPRAIQDGRQAEVYLQTVNERELDHAVFSADAAKRGSVACFFRKITDLRKNLQDYLSKDYVDVHNLKPEVDAAKFERHEELKDTKLPPQVGFNNVHEYSVTWHKDGVMCPTTVRAHAQYLDGLANEFYDTIRIKLERAMAAHSTLTALPSYGLYEEIAQHVNFVQERSASFYGRKGCLQCIKEYLLGDNTHPLILCGAGGGGKTSLIAKACQLTASWFKSREPVTVVRFIGLTAESENIRALLQGICQQISHTYHMDLTAVPEEFHALVNDLEGRISIATSERPLVIYLDSPDRLSPDHKGRSMTWLPSNLPGNVKIVVSCTTVSDEKTEAFRALKKQCPDSDVYDIPAITDTEANFIINHLLQREGRCITEEQRIQLFKTLQDNQTPLFLRLACDHALKWRSYSELRETNLSNDLRKLILGMFASLESKHGEPLVRRALGYLTAARNGLSWSELQDLLSCDEHVMTDIANHHAPPLRRMPPALWCRLKADLRRYFRAWKVDGVCVWRWADNQFREAATSRYLNAKDKAPSYHSALTEYFMGRWGERKKPYPAHESGADRFVDPQPLMFNHVKPSGAIVREYNMRKLSELPFHLLHSLQPEKLKAETLINYEWTLAKLRATSLRRVLDDLQSALTLYPNDLELRMLSETLHLSSSALLKDPNQLASQLVGRIHGIIKNDKPMSIGDPKKYQTIAAMLSQAQRSSIPALIPSVTCLAQPGGVLYDLLAGHTEVITAVTASRVTIGVAATASKDGTVKMWDLKKRKVTKTIEGVGKEVSSLRLCMSDTIVVAVESSSIKIISVETSSTLLHITQYIDPPVVTTAGEVDDVVVAFFSGANVMRSWDVSCEDAVRMLTEVDIGGATSIHKDGSLCASFSANGDRVLYAPRSGCEAYVINGRTGNKVHTLATPKKSASITALGISKDYYVVACRYLYMKVSEIHQLELFDIKNGKYLRAVAGCTNDVVNELHVNRLGSHALSVTPNGHTNTTTLAVWNLETEDHKHLAKHPHISRLGACVDLMYCLTASSANKSLRIWNLSRSVNERDEKAHRKKSAGIDALYPMVRNPRYVVAKAVDNGPLSVWNVVKGKCADNAVRIERGLVDNQDVVLIRNHRVVILSELGISSVSANQSQVFQTVYVYDLGSKKYVRKLTGVFIVPAPAAEYRILDGELLLGLSENRDHFIAWNLVSGHIKFRIKTNFKMNRQQMKREDEELKDKLQRQNTANMSPWDRRSETSAERQKRKEQELEKEKKRLDEMRKEKENAIQQYVMSHDERVIVCSYFAHHLCVFDVDTQQHMGTLQNQNSMMYLYVSALTPEGKYLVHANYDDAERVSYVTVWNLQKGDVRKRLKREPNVCCLGMNDCATRVLFGNERHQLKVWDIQRGRSSLRRLQTSTQQSLHLTTATRIFMLEGGSRALVVGSDLTLWDLDNACQLAMFTPDLRLSCVEVVMQGQLIALGLRDSPDVVTLRLKGRDIKPPDFSLDTNDGKELFGETTGDTSSEEEEEDDESDDDQGQ